MQTRSAWVVATPAAVEAIRRLVAERGPVMFVQSGGCCDGSLPMCFAAGEFITGPNDINLGQVEGCPVFIDARQYQLWQDSILMLDIATGDPEGFSLPAGDNLHFVSKPVPVRPPNQPRTSGPGP